MRRVQKKCYLFLQNKKNRYICMRKIRWIWTSSLSKQEDVLTEIENKTISENSSVGRAQPCQGWGRGFESRFSLFFLCPGGGTGRRVGLKIQWPVMAVRVQVPPWVPNSKPTTTLSVQRNFMGTKYSGFSFSSNTVPNTLDKLNSFSNA